MSRILLIRHGQTNSTFDDLLCGRTEVPLDNTGLEQALCLAHRLQDYTPTAIYCSPQHRAQQTAMPAAKSLNLRIHFTDALREIDFGEWEQHSRPDLRHRYPQQMAAWERGSWRAQPPGGETQQEVIARSVSCVIRIMEAHVGETVAIVSHKTVLRLLIGQLLGLSIPESRALKVDPCSISVLWVIEDQVRPVILNDTSHLSGVHRADKGHPTN